MQNFFLGECYPPVYMRHHKVVTEPCFSRDHRAVFRHVDRVGTGERIIMPRAEDGEHGDGIFGATTYDLSELGSGARARPSSDNLGYFLL